MTVRPILFSGAMVRAILDGRKSQTRRVIKGVGRDNCLTIRKPTKTRAGIVAHVLDAAEHGLLPYAPGDLLWVRETWSARMTHGWTITDARSRMYEEEILYQADGEKSIDGWWPSIHMPREFSRLTLEVTAVRVQRLQDISEDDAQAEGVIGNAAGPWGCEGLIEDYANLWDSLNEKRDWDANPWVAAISFEVHKINVDALIARRIENDEPEGESGE